MARPTEAAIDNFSRAKLRLRNEAAKKGGRSEEALAQEDLLNGLQDLARGLRATYMLLEEIKGLLLKNG